MVLSEHVAVPGLAAGDTRDRGGRTSPETHPSGSLVDFRPALAVADAVLYEGYLLYPYRQSSPKNRSGIRWQFGVLAPRGWLEGREEPAESVAGSAEWWSNRTECLLEATEDAEVEVVLRYLRGSGDASGERPGRGSESPGQDTAEPSSAVVRAALADLLGRGERAVEVGKGPSGPRGRLTLRLDRLPARTPLYKLSARVENTTEGPDPGTPRTVALRHSLVATHLLLGVSPGAFLSLLDPPAWARPAVAECRNVRTFPVLAGPSGSGPVGTSRLMISSPILLYDHPQVAPESPGDLFDATEIDEILSLRTMTLTEHEKAEARATDPRAAELIDRIDGMPDEVFARLHGAVRSLRPVRAAAMDGGAGTVHEGARSGADERSDGSAEPVVVAGTPIGAGSRVRLRPRGRGTDVQDRFLEGRSALVRTVLTDVDGSRFLAVELEGDPRAELGSGPGRLLHFSPDEVLPG